MPIGLPRVRVGLQPFFDRPTTTPPSLNSTSSLSSSSSGSSNLHPPTPNTTPVATPPRTESPQPGAGGTTQNDGIHSNNEIASSSGNVSGLSSRHDPIMRKSFAACSAAAHLAKAPAHHPSPPPPPSPNASSVAFPSSSPPAPSAPSGDAAAIGHGTHVDPTACTHPSPLSQSEPISESDTPSPSSPLAATAVVDSASSTAATDTPDAAAQESHPALVLTSTLLAQRTPSPLNDSEFPHPLRSKAPSGSNSSPMSPQRKLKRGFQFMALLPPSPTENSDDATSSSPSSPTSSSPPSPALEGHLEGSQLPPQTHCDGDPLDVASCSDDDDSEDDVSRASMSPADLIAIGSGGVGISSVMCVTSSLVSATKMPAAPPSEADTESTLHSDGDHLDHTTDVDRMTEAGDLSSCGCCSSSVSSHEPEPELEEEPEEPDEPDEPDLSSEDMMRLLIEDISTLPVYSATTELDVDLDAAVGAKAAAVAYRDETGSDSDSASADSDASATPTDGQEMVSTPAPKTLTKIKDIVGAAVVDDEDVSVRVRNATERGRSPDQRPGIRDSVLVMSPLAAKAVAGKSPRTASPSPSRSPLSPSASGNPAWSQVLW